jgi:adenylate cyclase
MEGLAEGGGICLSGTVYDAIENKIGLAYEDLGEQEVKNISKPVRAYRVTNLTGEKKTKSRAWRKVAVATGIIAVLLAGAAGVVWNVYFRLPDVTGVPGGMKEFELPEGPSIAVLPFVNMSGDPEQEFFSDGLTENIIAGLSSDRRLLVIARNSTFAYKGTSPDIQKVARKLGVQYVVEGSVQKTEDRVRITAQLIDANTGHHVRSDRYDRELKDIFALQDEITMKIMVAVGVKLVSGKQFTEKIMPPSGNLEAYEKFLKAYWYFSRMNKEDNVVARQELEEAIALDPEYPVLYSTLAYTHLMDLFLQSSKSPELSFVQATKNVKKALALDDEDYVANLTLAQLYVLRKERDKAIDALERTIALYPNGSEAYAHLCFVLTGAGKPEEAIKLIEKAMRLNPIPPVRYHQYLADAYAGLGRYEDAIEVHKKILKRSPNYLFSHIALTSLYMGLGREEEARHQSEELLRLDPAFSLDKYAELLSLVVDDKVIVERIISNLRKAGLK